ncbi:MAG: HmuY family protein [Bacteroidales bacterium]|nr:HmuY family protein [Bacteroidales bacterium]
MTRTVEGQLYLDASDWGKWHYLDLEAVADSIRSNPGYNPSSAWETMDIPTSVSATTDADGLSGLYTYWYDVFGEGISRYEFRSFDPTSPQPEPEKWSIAIHRNNIRTNHGSIAATSCRDIDRLPTSVDFLESLIFEEDIWSETDVWVNQDRMLMGLIGNQGIKINRTGSGWLRIDIPPMPPSFTLDNSVFIVKLNDGTYAALQLEDYQNAAGVKCCLTINYRYPLSFQ